MATGIQTGMRTGSRLATGRGPAAGPGGGGPLGKVGELWGKLSPKVKILLFVVIGLAITGGLTYTVVSASNKPVDLYATKMTPLDVEECSKQLTALNIKHEVKITGDSITLHPSDLVRARNKLAEYGLPRHEVMTKAPESGMGTQTESQQRAMGQRILEGQITETLRQFDGVADAYVKLAIPEMTYFKDDQRSVTAMVMLKLQPGIKFNRNQISALMHLVAASVPDLKAENVQIVDKEGTNLTAMVPNGDDAGLGAMTPGELKDKDEADKQGKVQAALDRVLGPGRSVATVNVEFDYSQTETTRKVMGPTVEVGSQRVTEEYNRNPGGGTSENGAQMSANPGSNGGYKNEKVATKREASETVAKVVDRAPRIKRITCSVAVDNIPEDKRAMIAGLVRDTVGLDESRGDSCTVISMPFMGGGRTDFLAAGNEALENGQALPPSGHKANAPIDGKMVALMMFFPAMILLAVVAVFLLKQHKVQVDKSAPLLGATGGATASDISDLLNEKSGKTTAMGETRVNTTEQLEKLAKERPTKVAEMLKSTWLSQGG